MTYCDRYICNRRATVRGRYETKVRNFCTTCAKELAGWKDTTIDKRHIKQFAARVSEHLGVHDGGKALMKRYRSLVDEAYFEGKHVGDVVDLIQGDFGPVKRRSK